ncbi:uncharacterized protein [Cherax quadricarinatus]
MNREMGDGLLLLRTYMDTIQSTKDPDTKSQPENSFAERLLQEHRCKKHSEVQSSDFAVDNYDAAVRGHDAVEIQWSPPYGRYLVAARDIDAGEVILREKPLLIVPRINSEPTCLACMKPLGKDWEGCNLCGGPLCSPHCAGTYHGKKECILICRIGIKNSQNIESCIKQLNILLGPLRVLLMFQESPETTELFFALQSHEKERRKMHISRFVEEHVVRAMETLLGLEVDSGVVHRVCGVLDTNAFELSLDQCRQGRAIFILSSMMNHSCLSNAQRWYSEGNMVVRASVDISKGTPLFISYTQSLWGTRARRAHLSVSKMFLCKCKRCLDSTELGSHMSSIPCRECQGLVVPPDDSCSYWTCTLCGKRIDANATESLVRAGAIAMNHLPKDDTAGATLILEHLKRQLGDNHYIVAQIKYAVVQAIINRPLKDVTSRDLTRVVTLTKELITLATIIEPGITRFRGLLLLEQTRAWSEILQRCLEAAPADGGRSLVAGEGRCVDADEGPNTSDDINHNDELVHHSNNIPSVQMLLSQVAECEYLLQYDPRLPEVTQLAHNLRLLLKSPAVVQQNLEGAASKRQG